MTVRRRPPVPTAGDDVKPLSARSALLSLVLGAPEGGLSAQELVRSGAHLGIAEPTVRVALTRAVAKGELRRTGTTYGLGPRLLARRRRHQDRDAVTDWDGTWELVVVVGPARPSRERAALRARLTAARLAELREGVWMRPANLARPVPEDLGETLRSLRADGVADPAALVAELWDLSRWAARTRATLGRLAEVGEPARRLAVAARLVRLLAEDPLLPPELLPADWPAPEAREAYAAYQAELLRLATGSQQPQHAG